MEYVCAKGFFLLIRIFGEKLSRPDFLLPFFAFVLFIIVVLALMCAYVHLAKKYPAVIILGGNCV